MLPDAYRLTDSCFALLQVPALIAFMSQSTTLRKGTIVMTGTPGGVGCTGPESDWRALRHNDVVEVEITGLGRLQNTVVYN